MKVESGTFVVTVLVEAVMTKGQPKAFSRLVAAAIAEDLGSVNEDKTYEFPSGTVVTPVVKVIKAERSR